MIQQYIIEKMNKFEIQEMPPQPPLNKTSLGAELNNSLQGMKINHSKISNALIKKIATQRSLLQGRRSFTSQLKNKMNLEHECVICYNTFEGSGKTGITNCAHSCNFCESCMEQHIFLKLSAGSEVLCPEQNCNQAINPQSNSFKQLPLRIQNLYLSWKKFQEERAQKKSGDKPCTKPNCPGYYTAEGQKGICSICKSKYCTKCFLKQHQGACEDNELRYLEEEYNFRRCDKCLSIIQKTEGCNHIKCICRYQFCYICKEQWSFGHLCKQKGQAKARDQALLDCSCLHNACGDKLAWTMKAPLKLFLFIFMAGGLCLYFIFYFLIYLIFMLLVSVVQGLTCFTFNFLFEQDAVSLPLWIILLPVVILIGIGIAISEVFKTIAVREMRFMIQRFSLAFSRVYAI